MGKSRKGVEPAGLKAYRLGKKRAKSSRRKSSGGTTAKKKSGKKRGGGVAMASMMPTKDIGNGIATIFGVWVATEYKDHPKLVQYIKDPKVRYAVIAGAGLGLAGATFIPVLPKWTAKATPMVRAFALGIGLGGGMSAAKVLFPKLLPAPKGTTTLTTKNGAVIQQPTTRMGRLPSPAVKRLREFIRDGEERMNGRMPRNVMTGRRGIMTGRRGVMTGRYSDAFE